MDLKMGPRLVLLYSTHKIPTADTVTNGKSPPPSMLTEQSTETFLARGHAELTWSHAAEIVSKSLVLIAESVCRGFRALQCTRYIVSSDQF